MFKKILKWTGIIVLSVLLMLVIVVSLRQDLDFEAPYPSVSSSTDSAMLERGRYLVYGPAHCADCHSDPSKRDSINKGFEVVLAGGNKFELPFGTIYTKNITPDMETGIGEWTDQEIARTLRYGVNRRGKAVVDFMPFHNTSDEDLSAIISFLKSQQPVKNKIPEHEFNAIGKILKAFIIKPVGPNGDVPVSVPADSTAGYGYYMANNIANCSGCHTPRSMMTGAPIGREFSGGNNIDGFLVPDISSASGSRINNWSQEQFIQRFRKGRLIEKSPMPWGSFSRMSDTELKAIYKYLNSLETTKPSNENLARQ